MVSEEELEEFLDELEGVHVPSFIDGIVEMALDQMESTNNYSAMRYYYMPIEEFIEMHRAKKKQVLINFCKQWGYWTTIDEKYGKKSLENEED